MKRTSTLQLGFLGTIVLAAGCGGGGAGHSSSSSRATTFAANSIVYGVANGTNADYKVNEVDPTGSSVQTVFSDVPGTVLLFALNPHVSGQYVVAADPTGAGAYGLYLTKDLTLTGATTLVAPGYTAVNSLAVTADGAHVVYAATNSAGVSDLYVLPLAGGTPSLLAVADGSAVSPADSDTIAYVAPVDGLSGNDEVFTRSLAAGATGTVRTITSDGTNHALPTFSRDGTKLAYWQVASGANALIVETLATLASVSLPGLTNVDPQGEAFNAAGTSLSLVGEVGTTGEILTQPVDGVAAPTVTLTSSALLGNYGLYWTDASGRMAGGFGGLSSASRIRRR